LIALGMALSLAILFLEEVDQMDFTSEPFVQIWILHLAAFILLPSAIQLPQYQHVLTYIPQRISLLLVVSFCMMVANAAYGRGITRLSSLVAVAFFTFLYMDSTAFNQAEDQITSIVQQAPAGARVVVAISDQGARLNAMAHVGDRACIGHCFSYTNYEPGTGQFRIRSRGGIEAPSMQTVLDIERGQHIATAAEAPLYAICPGEAEEGRSLVLRKLGQGDRTCSSNRVFSVRLLDGILKEF